MVSSRLAAAWRFIKGFNLYAYPAGGIFMKKNCKRILGQIGDRLAAGRRFCRVQGRYAYPAGAYFCSCKSRQNTLGAVPQDPLAAKLRLDTDWAFQLPLKSRSAQRRRYALKVPAAHFMLGNCKPIAGSHDVEPMGWISSCLPRRPLPRYGGRGTGWGQIRRGYLWSASVRSTDLDFSPQKNLNPYPAQLSVKGVCQGGIRPP